MTWIDDRAFRIVCPRCSGSNLVSKTDYDTIQGFVFLVYCEQCEPESFARVTYEQSDDYEAKAAKIFGRAPRWRKFDA
jgi:hypothetical protein